MATIFRSPILITTYRLPKAQPEYVVTLQTLYAPNPDRPFRQSDWPLTARGLPSQDAAAPANLNPLFYPNPSRPFHQDWWDRPPLLPKAKAIGEVGGTINTLLTPNPARPFSQGIWDTARAGQSKPKVDDFANLLPFRSVVVTAAPFVQSDWLNSAKKPIMAGAESYSGPAALLTPNPSMPFSTSLWENAASPRAPTKVDTVNLLLPLYSPFNPFVNSTEHRVFARQQIKSDIFVNFLPLRVVPPPAGTPFYQDDWPLAMLAARPASPEIIANAFLPGNVPPPPVVHSYEWLQRARRRGRR